MDVSDAIERRDRIQALAKAGDYEAAHVKEDSLLWEFVDWIASDESAASGLSYTEIRGVAQAIQSLGSITYPRHCA